MTRLAITRGDDEIVDLTFTDRVTGDPVDLAGADLWLYVKEDKGDPDADALVRKDNVLDGDGGIEVTDAPGGLASVTFDAEDTAELDCGAFYWAVQMGSGGTARELDGGRFSILQDLIHTPNPPEGS